MWGDGNDFEMDSRYRRKVFPVNINRITIPIIWWINSSKLFRSHTILLIFIFFCYMQLTLHFDFRIYLTSDCTSILPSNVYIYHFFLDWIIKKLLQKNDILWNPYENYIKFQNYLRFVDFQLLFEFICPHQ